MTSWAVSAPPAAAGRRAGRVTAAAAAGAILLVKGGAFCLSPATPPPAAATAAAGASVGALGAVGAAAGAAGAADGLLRGAGLCGAALAACGAARAAARRTARRAAARADEPQDIESPGRRTLFAAVAAAPVAGLAGAARAEIELPDRIGEDPYGLVGISSPEDTREINKEFFMKKKYREDTYQVVKHMKISGSLDKGTPNMEKWNKRVKEEMDDWVALYRRQDLVVGRQSYYQLYSAVNALASHYTSYGPKFPFPSKRRARFYELINTTEKYLEKGK